MNSTITCISMICMIAVCSSFLVAQKTNGTDINPFTHFGENTMGSFAGNNALLFSAAIASTFFIVQSDVDYYVHDYFSQNIARYDKYTTVALWGGYIAPLAIGGGMYLWGKRTDDQRLYAAGCAVLQAAGIAQLTVSVLKAVTGRPNPDPTAYPDMREASHIFRFGFLRGGLHYGWPSGHLAVNSAVISTLMSFYNKSTSMQIFGGICIAYMIFGVSAHEGATMHWFSDVVAGTILGCVIGSRVGSDFRGLLDGNSELSTCSKMKISPTLSSRFMGIQIRVPL